MKMEFTSLSRTARRLAPAAALAAALIVGAGTASAQAAQAAQERGSRFLSVEEALKTGGSTRDTIVTRDGLVQDIIVKDGKIVETVPVGRKVGNRIEYFTDARPARRFAGRGHRSSAFVGAGHPHFKGYYGRHYRPYAFGHSRFHTSRFYGHRRVHRGRAFHGRRFRH